MKVEYDISQLLLAYQHVPRVPRETSATVHAVHVHDELVVVVLRPVLLRIQYKRDR